MVKEEYVSFELARLLQKKGFDGMCEYVWILDKANDPDDTDGIWKECAPKFMEGESRVSLNDIDRVLSYSDDYYHKEVYLCPTLYMALKWIREEKGVNVIDLLDWSTPLPSKYYFELYIYHQFEGWKPVHTDTNLAFTGDDKLSSMYTSPEEALEGGMKYALKKLIKE